MPIWTIGTCGSNRSASCRQSAVYHSSHQIGQSCSTVHQDTGVERLLSGPHSTLVSRQGHTSHSADWEDIIRSMETLSPALSFWVSRPPRRKQYNAFRKSPPHLQTLMLDEGLNVQTVNDLLTMYVGCCQSTRPPHGAFEPEQAGSKLRQTGYRPFGPVSCIVILLLGCSFYPLKLGGLGVCSAVRRHSGCVDGNNAMQPDHQTHFSCSTPLLQCTGYLTHFSKFNTTSACPTWLNSNPPSPNK